MAVHSLIAAFCSLLLYCIMYCIVLYWRSFSRNILFVPVGGAAYSEKSYKISRSDIA